MERVSERALESAAGKAAVGLHVPDHRFDCAAPAQVAPERRRHPAALARDERLGRLHTVAAVAAVDEGPPGPGLGQDLHLLQRLAKGVPVIGGVAGHRPHADDEALPVRGCHRHLSAELVTDPRLALGDAVHLGSCSA